MPKLLTETITSIQVYLDLLMNLIYSQFSRKICLGIRVLELQKMWSEELNRSDISRRKLVQTYERYETFTLYILYLGVYSI